MMVKGKLALLGLFFLVLMTSAYAATLSVAPATVYEGTTRGFTVSVNNYQGNNVITSLNLVANGFNIVQAAQYQGWTTNFGGSTASWNGGTIETNVYEARFEVNATAPIVNQNTNQSFDTTTNEGTTYHTVTVLNDPTSPFFISTIPTPGSYLLANNPNQLIQAIIEDNETGIKVADFGYRDCTTNSSALVNLSCNAQNPANCNTQLNLASYDEGEQMCFVFTATNYAGDSATRSGSVGFDGTAPTVVINGPAANSAVSASTQISFTATDNLAPTLNCQVRIDGNNVLNLTAPNNVAQSFTLAGLNITEGNHTLRVTCFDAVGLSSYAERVYEIDVTPPVITLTNPSNGYLGNNQIITATATDLHGIASLVYSVNTNSSSHPEGSLTFNVTAMDTVGNSRTTEFTIIIDKTAPILNIAVPQANVSVDGNAVDVNFTTTDNLGQNANCNASFATGQSSAGNAVFGQLTKFVVTSVPLGATVLTVTCADEAGNSVTSAVNPVNIIDMSGPTITANLIYLIRGSQNVVQAVITDVSGVASAQVEVFAQNYTMSNVGNNTWQATVTPSSGLALGVYNAVFRATDTLGYSSSFTDQFNLITGYDIDVNLNPNPAEPSESYTISGTVTYDDGSAVAEQNVTIILPSGSSVVVALTNGSYTYTTTAPANEGNYPVTARVVSNNGYNYSRTTTLTVEAPGGAGSHSGGQRESSRSPTSSPGSPESSPSSPESPSESQTAEESGVSEYSAEAPSGETSGEEAESRATSPTGVGKASGLFSLSFLKANWWILLLLAAVVAGLITLSYYRKDGVQDAEVKQDEEDSWTNYFTRKK